MRPRILVLSQCLPYPPHSGVANRTFNILRQLQHEFDVHLLAFSRRNHQPDEASRQAARDALRGVLGGVYDPVAIPSELGAGARLWCHFRSILAWRPYTYYEYSGRRFARALEVALAEVQPALVHVDSLDLYRWLDHLPATPVAVTHHSVESELLRSRARYLRPILRQYVLLQARLMEGVERRLARAVWLNVMMSETDARRLARLAPGARMITVGNGVDIDVFRPRPESDVVAGRVAFLGPTYMFPNRDAVEYFLREIWDSIRSTNPAASFEIIGKIHPAHRRVYVTYQGVIPLGYVPDVRPHLAQAACVVVPIRVGGGTRLKILDAWAMGKAVVSTSVGCEGLDAVDGENILIRDEPGPFADAVLAVLANEQLRRRLGRGGRLTVERSYSWEALGAVLRSAYREVIAEAARSRLGLRQAG